MFTQTIISGLTRGCIYSLIALGYYILSLGTRSSGSSGPGRELLDNAAVVESYIGGKI